MKKILVIILLLVVTGCKKETIKIEYDDSFYQVAKPYKIGIENYSLSSYDKEKVNDNLMDLSSNYYKIDNSLYQDGQFLDEEFLKKIVNEINPSQITIDNVSFKPNYIATIYEQNYLNMDNKLKGISLALVVKDEQIYNNHKYKFDKKEVLDYALTKVNYIVEQIRKKEELKKVKLLIGIYLDSNYQEGFKYLGYTESNSIKMDYVNYSYEVIESNYIMKNDHKTYNSMKTIKNSLDGRNIYINSIGLYKNKNLQELYLYLNKDFYNRSEILNISEIVTDNLKDINANIKIYFKSNNIPKAFLTKKYDEKNINMYILEG